MRIFLFTAFRPALGPTEPPIQCTRVSYIQGKATGVWGFHGGEDSSRGLLGCDGR